MGIQQTSIGYMEIFLIIGIGIAAVILYFGLKEGRDRKRAEEARRQSAYRDSIASRLDQLAVYSKQASGASKTISTSKPSTTKRSSTRAYDDAYSSYDSGRDTSYSPSYSSYDYSSSYDSSSSSSYDSGSCSSSDSGGGGGGCD